MLRRFFYAAAAVFLLTLAFEIGASSVSAQAGVRVVGSNLVMVNGEVYGFGPAGWQSMGSLPVSADQVAWATAGSGANLATIVTESGEGWLRPDAAAGWVNYGPAPGSGPTQAVRASWGELKNRYR